MKEVKRIPLGLNMPTKPSMAERIIRRVFGVQEAVSRSALDSFYVLERLSKDSDSTEISGTNRMEKLKLIRKMYRGEAGYGNIPCSSVVNFNKTFQWSNGLIVLDNQGEEEAQEGASPEAQVLEEFLDYNDLNEEMGMMLGVEGELSGQVAMRWSWDKKANNVKLFILPLLETQYVAVYKPGNYTQLDSLLLHPGTEKEESIPGDQVVFLKFRGTINGTYGVATPMPCLPEMQDFDKARVDLRKVNHLFAFPTPILRAKTTERVKQLNDAIQALNWKIGKALVMMEGEGLEYAEIKGTGSQFLMDEMKMLLQHISAVTDVPIHFLGHPELLSNRATSNDLFEAPVKRAMAEQRVWMGGFEELIQKVLPIYAMQRQLELFPDKVAIAFPPVRVGNREDIIKAWLPVWVSKGVSHQTFLSEIGIDDPDQELKLLLDEAAAAGAARPAVPGDEELDREVEEAAAAAEGEQARGAA
jgi:hypothetical protein